MAECGNIERCSFFKAYACDADKSLAVAGFLRIYCRGPKQDECLRKKVSAALGGADHVPPNMLPNGMAMTGTKTDDWPQVAKDIRKQASLEKKG